MKEIITYNNLISEQKIIGWMTYTRKFINIPEAYFYKIKLRDFYKKIKEQYLKNNAIDPDILFRNEIEFIECLDTELSYDPKNAIYELEKCYKKRLLAYKILEITDKIKKEDNNFDDIIIDFMNYQSKLIIKNNTLDDYNHEKNVTEYILDVKEKMDKAGCLKGIRSGLKQLDETINGWQHGNVYLISGLEKLGKSRFVRSLASNWLNDGYGGIFFMLEEDSFAIHECILAKRNNINTSVIGTQKISPMELAKLCKSTEEYKKQNLHICNKSAITADYIKAVVTQIKTKFIKAGGTLDFIVIDYIQRLEDPAENLNEKAENLAAKLANLTRDEKLITIQISQLISSAEKTKAPVHTQLRFGKPYKEAASCIISFDDPERMGEKVEFSSIGKPLNCHIIQRKGIGNIFFKIYAQLQYSNFVDCEENRDRGVEW